MKTTEKEYRGFTIMRRETTGYNRGRAVTKVHFSLWLGKTFVPCAPNPLLRQVKARADSIISRRGQ